MLIYNRLKQPDFVIAQLLPKKKQQTNKEKKEKKKGKNEFACVWG